MASIKPLHDRVVIERVEAEEKTASGIVLPGSATEKPDMGIVVAVGNGKTLDSGTKVAMCVKVGDKVVFGKYSGQQVKLDNKEYTIMNESEILGVIA
ncbi:MAG: co-chaperone GroES [Burkholderiales bacterium]|nr:co-chaperone GroES [Burkholderiales bacterium]